MNTKKESRKVIYKLEYYEFHGKSFQFLKEEIIENDGGSQTIIDYVQSKKDYRGSIYKYKPFDKSRAYHFESNYGKVVATFVRIKKHE